MNVKPHHNQNRNLAAVAASCAISGQGFTAVAAVAFKDRMYDMTPEQLAAEKILNKQGFKFSNWIDAQDGNDSHGCMVMVKRGQTRYGKEYREIAPDGSIN